MSEVAIAVEQLSKRYRINQGARARYGTLRDRLADALAAPWRRPRAHSSTDAEHTLWALRDISFEVRRGEVLGIIGRNGAGKSTLLKILSRITRPTEGRVTVRGRVGSLLEVGTGFHPELTGRENIYLNGAILGMKRQEISRKFDEIVGFAEVEQFIDTPVKFYSSGMYTRLAFAVAAHLESEILVVDEVLAVGDAAFQKKCLGRMGAIADHGRTVLFVSHDMTNIAVLCQRAIVLDTGQVSMDGAPAAAIERYLSRQAQGQARIEWQPDHAPGDDIARMLRVAVCRCDSTLSEAFFLQESVMLEIEYMVLRDDVRLNPVFTIQNSLGVVVFSTSNFEDQHWSEQAYPSGRYRAQCRIPEHLLNEGQYFVNALLVQETRFTRALAERAVQFAIHDDGSTRGSYVGTWVGVVRPRCIWRTTYVEQQD
jgi:homopolymeric O-antigen transport system ATP-binding protein